MKNKAEIIATIVERCQGYFDLTVQFLNIHTQDIDVIKILLTNAIGYFITTVIELLIKLILGL